MNARSLGSPITISAPSLERMMSSIACRNSVPGAIAATAESTFGSRRGSTRAGWRTRPSGGGIRAPALSSLGWFCIDRCPRGFPKRPGFQNAKFAPNFGFARGHGGLDPELGAFLEPPLRLGRRPQPAREADLAECRELRLHRFSLCRGDDCGRDREVGTRLVDRSEE